MIDRLSTFSDPGVIELLKTKFVPATDNDWYNRRRTDAAGRFFMEVAKQGPRGEGDGTKQGHYILTASGKLLGFNNNRSLERRMAFIEDALAKWEALPAAERAPGAVEVPELDSRDRYHADPPEGGIVLVASERILKRAAGGTLAACGPDDHDHGWGHLAAVDRVWIRKGEWEAMLATANAGGGDVPTDVALRLARFHLTDFTRGEPPFWKRDEVRSSALRIEPIPAEKGRFRLIGKAAMATADGVRGYEADLLGAVQLDTSGTRPARFDLVALGDHWGEGPFTRGARPGKTPLGIAFRLGDLEVAADRVRPQASHWLDGYYHPER